MINNGRFRIGVGIFLLDFVSGNIPFLYIGVLLLLLSVSEYKGEK